jgi:soluble lytic murein transglycosylase-like protein
LLLLAAVLVALPPRATTVAVPVAAGARHPLAGPPPAAVPDITADVYGSLSGCAETLSDTERAHLAAVVAEESDRYGYDPLFVVAIIDVESGCSPTARGPGGSVGLVQVMPSTARALAREARLPWRGAEGLTSPALNVQLGVRYLAQLEQRFRDPQLALAAYNLGPARVARMPRERARNARYVRRVIARYEQLLASPALDRT